MGLKTIFFGFLGFLGIGALVRFEAFGLGLNEFDTYLHTHGLANSLKPGSGEYKYRLGLFNSEISRLERFDQSNGWVEGLNYFTIWSPEEKTRSLGFRKDFASSKLHDLDKSKSRSKFNTTSLPQSIDWRDRGVATAVKDQGHCGSCWAFASAGVVESHGAIKYPGKLFDLSPQQIASCAPNPNMCGGTGGCEGSTAELAFEYLASTPVGALEEFEYGYTSYYSGVADPCAIPNGVVGKFQIDGYVKLEPNSYWDLMEAIGTIGPIAISVDASNWHAYSSGIFDGCDQANPDINHAVILMGYGTDPVTKQDYWLVRNSWSASWGENGYIRLARSESSSNSCGIDITPSHGTACAGETEPVKVCGTCGILYDSSYPVIN